MTTRVMIMRMVIKNDDKKGDEVDEENLVESDKYGGNCLVTELRWRSMRKIKTRQIREW